jgi:hypothetical protein
MREGQFDYVVHTAAPLVDDPRLTDFERDFLIPSVAGYVSSRRSRIWGN